MTENQINAPITPLEKQSVDRTQKIFNIVKRVLGFGLLVFLLVVHIFVKELNLLLLAIPGLIMQLDIKSILDFTRK